MPNGRFIGMYSAPIAPWPHQEIVSRKLVESYPYSYMLCDEVGLGKTIESALALRSLILSGRVNRALIIAPAGLTDQWQRELAEKSMLPFVKTKSKSGQKGKLSHTAIYPKASETVDEAMYSSGYNIVSSGLLTTQTKLNQLANCNYDVVLLDEAHYARRQNSQDGAKNVPRYTKLYQSLQAGIKGKCDSLWLATATPMQLNQIEVCDLFSLTDRVGNFKYDPTITLDYFYLLESLTNGKKISVGSWKTLGHIFQQLPALDSYYWKNVQTTLINFKNKKSLEQMVKRAPMTADIRKMLQVLFAMSPLSRVMMRHTRALLEKYRDTGKLNSNLAVREVLPICAIKFTQKEKELYDMLSKYCKELRKQIKKHAGISPQMIQFLLMSMQLRFSSSLYAIKLTLERRLANVKRALKYKEDGMQPGLFSISEEATDETSFDYYDDNDDDEDDVEANTILISLLTRSIKDLQWEKKQLESMLTVLGRNEETPSKMQKLLDEVQNRKIGERFKQTVIFTKYFDTLENIRYYFRRSPEMRVGIYSGKQTSYYDVNKHKDVNVSREEVKKLFLNGEIDILLCTDAAAEGLNLQTADLLINFDLGWNPMKLEQRIGRIDRIGQKYERIYVLNMCYQGSVEETVYDRLWTRLKSAFSAIGTQQVSMLPVTIEDFRDLQNGTVTVEELENRSRGALERKQRATRSMEFSANEQYEIYQKLSADMKKQQYPATLKDIDDAIASSSYFADIGAKKLEDGYWQIPETELLPAFSGTVEQLPTVSIEEFLSWGNPYLDKVFNIMESTLPKLSCIRRIELTEEEVTFVGYVVKTKAGVKLVSSYHQAAEIKDLDEDGVLVDEDIQFGVSELRKQVEDEVNALHIIKKAKVYNEEFARLHRLLIKRVAVEVLKTAYANSSEDVSSIIKMLQEGDTSLNGKQIYIPSKEFKNQELKLIFDVIEKEGKLFVIGSTLLSHSVADYLERTVNGMKKHTKGITVDRLIKSINDSVVADGRR